MTGRQTYHGRRENARHGGVVLILVVGIVALLAVMATGFLARMRQDANVADDVVRRAQNRLLLQAAMHYIQESSRLGFALMNGDGTCADPREACGWIDYRVWVPEDPAFTAASYTNGGGGSGIPENWGSRHIGPRAFDGEILWHWQKERYADGKGPVTLIEVTDGGEYLAVPTVEITGGGGTGAKARAVVAFDDSDPPKGPVVYVAVINGGDDYNAVPTVTFTSTWASAPNYDASQVELEGGTATAQVWPSVAVARNSGTLATPRYRWPALGATVRIPFYRQRRPPYAVGIDAVRNPIPADEARPTFGIPFLNNVDPLPQFAEVDQGAFNEVAPSLGAALPSGGMTLGQGWVRGDPRGVDASMNAGWFRIYREHGEEPDRLAAGGDQVFGFTGATFIITVGSGATRGYRDWVEVQAFGAEAEFASDPAYFLELRKSELRQWYRVEWSGAVGGSEDHIYAFAMGQANMKPEKSWFEQLPINSSRHIESGSRDQSSASLPRNYIGTIRYVERLSGPPSGNCW